jgi:hypothetical protein
LVVAPARRIASSPRSSNPIRKWRKTDGVERTGYGQGSGIEPSRDCAYTALDGQRSWVAEKFAKLSGKDTELKSRAIRQFQSAFSCSEHRVER